MNAAELAFLFLTGAEKAVELALKYREAAQQTNEWTAEEEEKFDGAAGKLETITSQDHWKREP